MDLAGKILFSKTFESMFEWVLLIITVVVIGMLLLLISWGVFEAIKYFWQKSESDIPQNKPIEPTRKPGGLFFG